MASLRGGRNIKLAIQGYFYLYIIAKKRQQILSTFVVTDIDFVKLQNLQFKVWLFQNLGANLQFQVNYFCNWFIKKSGEIGSMKL